MESSLQLSLFEVSFVEIPFSFPTSRPRSATNLQGKMGSNFVSKEDHHHQAPSRRGVRRTWSSNSSTCGQGVAAVPKCVCAPATHAGSFKCRLHRASSHGHSPPSPTSIRPPPPSANSSCAPTVEAQ
ncbi:unnamed protein product [Musa acuminata subsp. malaccensis]|uniref:(wild Malaysian banana) hypothetical protein n=1 Tax=Musa acuminata subsp. malaccensis TaxID=214687 RepID=A0A804KX97_MUSAM|nr:PREDICTED: uncharacterized protein LOC103968493 [Musa acuminata subsp. malaccensis]CAG1853801.1 unnamed protein product [Musa acuminata subsp. malaccensis]